MPLRPSHRRRHALSGPFALRGDSTWRRPAAAPLEPAAALRPAKPRCGPSGAPPRRRRSSRRPAFYSSRLLRSRTIRSTRTSSRWRGWSIRLLISIRQAVEVDPARPGGAVSTLHAPRPRHREVEPVRLLQQIDAVGRHAELHDLVAAAGRHVLRVARLGVVDEGQAADDQVADLVSLEEVEQVLEVPDGLCAPRAPRPPGRARPRPPPRPAGSPPAPRAAPRASATARTRGPSARRRRGWWRDARPSAGGAPRYVLRETFRRFYRRWPRGRREPTEDPGA